MSDKSLHEVCTFGEIRFQNLLVHIAMCDLTFTFRFDLSEIYKYPPVVIMRYWKLYLEP